MCDKALTEMFRNLENVDPLAHKVLTNDFEQASQGMESLGKRWNIPIIEEDAKLYQKDPELGMGRATAIGASIYAPYAAPGVWASMAPAAYQAMVPAMNAEQAAMLAAQTAGFGASGLTATMDAAGYAQGLSGMDSALAKAGGLLSGGGMKGELPKQMAMNMGMELMQPKEPQMQMPPPRPMQRQQEGPLPSPYNQGVPPGQNSMGLLGKDPSVLSEEEKKRLRMMGVKI